MADHNLSLTDLDNNKRYRAKIRSVLSANFGEDPNKYVEVYSSCDTPASSYDFQHWVYEDGNSYGQITLANPLYQVFDIEET